MLLDDEHRYARPGWLPSVRRHCPVPRWPAGTRRTTATVPQQWSLGAAADQANPARCAPGQTPVCARIAGQCARPAAAPSPAYKWKAHGDIVRQATRFTPGAWVLSVGLSGQECGASHSLHPKAPRLLGLPICENASDLAVRPRRGRRRVVSGGAWQSTLGACYSCGDRG
jgi:hypothetical protein